MASKSNIVVLTGEAAEAASKRLSQIVEKSKAELDAAGAKSYEAVILTPDGQAISAVDGDDGEG